MLKTALGSVLQATHSWPVDRHFPIQTFEGLGLPLTSRSEPQDSSPFICVAAHNANSPNGENDAFILFKQG